MPDNRLSLNEGYSLSPPLSDSLALHLHGCVSSPGRFSCPVSQQLQPVQQQSSLLLDCCEGEAPPQVAHKAG